MKILVLMPLDEKWSYIASALYQKMDTNAKNCTFAMPMFTEWQRSTGKIVIGNDLPNTWQMATFGSIVKAREMYKLQSDANSDFILIGNIHPDYKFDAIFNFQDIDSDMTYEDLYVNKLREIFKGNQEIEKYLNFYDASASQMPLHNIAAAAQFLSDYIKTDARLDKIKEKYKDTLAFKENHHAA